MMAGQSQTITGRVNAAGVLMSADPRLVALQVQAGGAPNGILAVPQLASVARLAQKLGILVSRNVIAAEGDHDLDLIVRARPEGEDVVLDIGGWVTQARAEQRFGVADQVPRVDVLWQADAELRITAVQPVSNTVLAVGQKLDEILHFEADGDGVLPIIAGLARRSSFSRQVARLDEEGHRLELSALPVSSSDGLFAGWRGRIVGTESMASQPLSSVPPDTSSAHIPTAADSEAVALNAALRAPLERIVAQADSLGAEHDDLASHYTDYARDVAVAGRHLLGLVDDLTDVQTIESAQFKVENDALDLADLARRAANLLRVRASDRHVRIDAPASDETMFARGDYRRVLQILVNLIGNAVRYSPPGAVVWVRTEPEDGLAALVVADQGKGIPPEAHERIFEKFARLDPSEPDGSGLGLYISRRLARAMGGDVSVDSAAGQGARFLLTLPSGAENTPRAPD